MRSEDAGAAWSYGIPLEEPIRNLNEATGNEGSPLEQTDSGKTPSDATNQR